MLCRSVWASDRYPATDRVTTIKTVEYGSTKHEILQIISDSQSTQLSQNDIKDVLGLDSQSAVSEHISDLEEMGLIERVHREGLPDSKGLTRQGYQFLWEGRGDNRPIPSESEEEEGDVFLHKFFLKFKISNGDQLEDGWRERWTVGREVRGRYLGDSDSYAYFRDDWKFRITGDHVLVHLSELRGYDATHLKNKALVEAFEAVRWLEEKAPVEVVSEPCETEVWVNQAEAGIISHPFALLVERYSSMSLQDVKVYDKSGRERLKMDSSHGPELEAPSREFHEEDIQHEINRLESQCENPERHKWIYEDMPEEVEELKSKVESLEEELEEQKSRPTELYPELDFSSKWVDRWGNLMAYCVDLEKPIKILDSEELPA